MIFLPILYTRTHLLFPYTYEIAPTAPRFPITPAVFVHIPDCPITTLIPDHTTYTKTDSRFFHTTRLSDSPPCFLVHLSIHNSDAASNFGYLFYFPIRIRPSLSGQIIRSHPFPSHSSLSWTSIPQRAMDVSRPSTASTAHCYTRLILFPPSTFHAVVHFGCSSFFSFFHAGGASVLVPVLLRETA